MPYTLSIARHRFYAWAACRAAQAGSAKAKRHEMLDALMDSGVVKFLGKIPDPKPTREELDKLFYEWVERAITSLKTNHNKMVAFGVAAKLVSVYLKGAYVLHSKVDSVLAQHIHPPIDSILLKSIDKANGTRLSKTHKWQKLDRANYELVISTLRNLNGDKPFWHIEKNWQP